MNLKTSEILHLLHITEKNDWILRELTKREQINPQNPPPLLSSLVGVISELGSSEHFSTEIMERKFQNTTNHETPSALDNAIQQERESIQNELKQLKSTHAAQLEHIQKLADQRIQNEVKRNTQEIESQLAAKFDKRLKTERRQFRKEYEENISQLRREADTLYEDLETSLKSRYETALTQSSQAFTGEQQKLSKTLKSLNSHRKRTKGIILQKVKDDLQKSGKKTLSGSDISRILDSIEFLDASLPTSAFLSLPRHSTSTPFLDSDDSSSDEQKETSRSKNTQSQPVTELSIVDSDDDDPMNDPYISSILQKRHRQKSQQDEKPPSARSQQTSLNTTKRSSKSKPDSVVEQKPSFSLPPTSEEQHTSSTEQIRLKSEEDLLREKLNQPDPRGDSIILRLQAQLKNQTRIALSQVDGSFDVNSHQQAKNLQTQRLLQEMNKMRNDVSHFVIDDQPRNSIAVSPGVWDRTSIEKPSAGTVHHGDRNESEIGSSFMSPPRITVLEPSFMKTGPEHESTQRRGRTMKVGGDVSAVDKQSEQESLLHQAWALQKQLSDAKQSIERKSKEREDRLKELAKKTRLDAISSEESDSSSALRVKRNRRKSRERRRAEDGSSEEDEEQERIRTAKRTKNSKVKQQMTTSSSSNPTSDTLSSVEPTRKSKSQQKPPQRERREERSQKTAAREGKESDGEESEVNRNEQSTDVAELLVDVQSILKENREERDVRMRGKGENEVTDLETRAYLSTLGESQGQMRVPTRDRKEEGDVEEESEKQGQADGSVRSESQENDDYSRDGQEQEEEDEKYQSDFADEEEEEESDY
ncbi:hypothetical protein BLNAU_15196 [Blattamonas nauphoetae]|uniref:Uncharacterized protein n=1 Tax=Blattamonas nauphoetae TaxID=2049346 RepID=A0ABQ9XF11_9EUKA|nr:hypothetical protein BLNAU_15196 [Blattamonas nauphoetae]